MEAFEPKCVNTILTLIEVNLHRLGDLQIKSKNHVDNIPSKWNKKSSRAEGHAKDACLRLETRVTRHANCVGRKRLFLILISLIVRIRIFWCSMFICFCFYEQILYIMACKPEWYNCLLYFNWNLARITLYYLRIIWFSWSFYIKGDLHGRLM